jgi:NAD(P)-dependent dehydrogenase (short-subunit alcohol dehydrogenase family)
MLTLNAGGSWYSTAKAGTTGFTKNLAVELKGKIRVIAVAPGGRKRSTNVIRMFC